MRLGLILLSLLLSAVAAAQTVEKGKAGTTAAAKPAVSPSNDVSPFDQHPECMNRSVDASTGKCVIQDAGSPRHRYPPKVQSSKKPNAAPPAGAGSSSTNRSSQ